MRKETKKNIRPLIGINTNYLRKPGLGPIHGTCQIGFTYIQAVADAGGIPVLIPTLADEAVLQHHVDRVDGFLFIGGPDYHPVHYGQTLKPETKLVSRERDKTDMLLGKMVLARGIPVLGICAGHQLINIICGGSLVGHISRAWAHCADKTLKKPKRKHHLVEITGGRLLKKIFGCRRICTNSSHHQAVDPAGVGQGLEIVARAVDGTVEAIEAVDGRFVLGVQWHPEAMRNNPLQKRIFRAFIEDACHRAIRAKDGSRNGE